MTRSHRQTPHQEPGLATRIMWRLAGVVAPVMRGPDCVTEWGRYARMGGAVLATAILSGVSTGWAAWTVFESADVALVTGICWGLMILNVDGLILAKTTKRSDATLVQQFVYAAPRIFFAVLIALAMSEPLKLQFFRGPIEAQLERERQEERLTAQQRVAPRYGEIAVAEGRITDLRESLAEKEEVVQRAYDDAAGEADGTRGSRIRNTGPIYRIKAARYEALSTELDSLRQTTAAEIDALRESIAMMRAERDAELSQYDQVLARADDLVARFLALYRLGDDPETGRLLWAVGWLFTLLLGSIEMTPVLSKLFGERGPYDAALQRREDVAVAQEDRRREEEVRGAKLLAEETAAVTEAVATAQNELVLDALKETLRGNTGARIQAEIVEVLEPEMKAAVLAMAETIAARNKPDARFAARVAELRTKTSRRAAKGTFDEARARANTSAVAEEAWRALDLYPRPEVNGHRREVL